MSFVKINPCAVWKSHCVNIRQEDQHPRKLLLGGDIESSAVLMALIVSLLAFASAITFAPEACAVSKYDESRCADRVFHTPKDPATAFAHEPSNVVLQIVAKCVVGGDEKESILSLFQESVRRRLGESVSIEVVLRGGWRALLAADVVADAFETIAMRRLSLLTAVTARALADPTMSTIMSTFSLSYQRRATLLAISGTF